MGGLGGGRRGRERNGVGVSVGGEDTPALEEGGEGGEKRGRERGVSTNHYGVCYSFLSHTHIHT